MRLNWNLNSFLSVACAGLLWSGFAAARIDSRVAARSGLGVIPESGLYVASEATPLVPMMIQSARSTLAIEIYEMQDLAVRRAIRDAIARGVRIQIVQEPRPVGATCAIFEVASAKDTPDCIDQRLLVSQVNARFGKYVAFNKAEFCGPANANCFEHGKIVIVDSQAALISTGNFNATSFCDNAENPAVCNRDYMLVTRDRDVVSTLGQIFNNDLAGVRYNLAALLTPFVRAKMTVSPFSLQPLVDFIGSARQSIELENQYLKDPTLNAALVQAAMRGVKVSITVSSACAFGKPTANETTAIQTIYGGFERAGISARFFTRKTLINGKPGYMHAKAIVVDHARAWVGSVNGSTTSVSANREYGIFINDPLAVCKLDAVINADHGDPGTESWQESVQCLKDH